MGVSPYYKGADCNFWALQDYKPQFVNATIHYLSKGLDTGDILYHALAVPKKIHLIISNIKSNSFTLFKNKK